MKQTRWSLRSKSGENLKENLSSHGARQRILNKILNKILKDFERSDQTGRPSASKSDKNLKENLSSHGASQRILNFPIKREQSQTCLSYAEREESQRS